MSLLACLSSAMHSPVSLYSLSPCYNVVFRIFSFPLLAADEKDKVYEYEGSDAEDEDAGGPPPPPPQGGVPKGGGDPFAPPPFANAAAQHRAAYMHHQQQQMAAAAAAQQQRGGRPVQPPRQPPTFLPAAQQPSRGGQPQQLVQRVGMYRPPPAVQQAQQQHRPTSQVFNGLDAGAGPRGSVIEVPGESGTAVPAEEHTLRQKFARFQVCGARSFIHIFLLFNHLY